MPSLGDCTPPNPRLAKTAELPTLNGIRALACLMVVIAHVPETFKVDTVGATGVALFFVLSGFLMGHLYGHKPWTVELAGRFAIARFARIAPIYWLTILTCAALTDVLGQADFPLHLEGWRLIGRHLLFGGSSFVFWSISPEVQFYLFFIFLWWSLTAPTRSSAHKAQRILILCLVCSSLLLTHPLWPGLSLPSKAHLFLAGCGAGLLPRNSINTIATGKYFVGIQLSALVLVALPIFLYKTQSQLYLATEVGPSMAIAVYALSFPSSISLWLFSSRWMHRIGQASFAIYLTHMLVLYAGARLLDLDLHRYEPLWLPVGILAIALPMVLSAYVEMPLQRMTRDFLNIQWSRHTRLSQEPA